MATEGQRSPQTTMLRGFLLWWDHLPVILSSSQQGKWVWSPILLRRPVTVRGLSNPRMAPDLPALQIPLPPSSPHLGRPSPYTEILRQSRRRFVYWRFLIHLQQVFRRRGDSSSHRGAKHLQEWDLPVSTSIIPQKKLHPKTSGEPLLVLRPGQPEQIRMRLPHPRSPCHHSC